jgi:hypothetical protein
MKTSAQAAVPVAAAVAMVAVRDVSKMEKAGIFVGFFSSMVLTVFWGKPELCSTII